MGKPYSEDLRDRVVAAMVSGRSCRDVGEASTWRRARRVTGIVFTVQGGGKAGRWTPAWC
jgi:transposase